MRLRIYILSQRCAVFLKVPDSKYFSLCRLYKLCCNSSILPSYHEYCHRQYAKKKKKFVARFNKILFNNNRKSHTEIFLYVSCFWIISSLSRVLVNIVEIWYKYSEPWNVWKFFKFLKIVFIYLIYLFGCAGS